MSSRSDPTDARPDDDHVTLGEYDARHGATCQQVLGWCAGTTSLLSATAAAGGSAAMPRVPTSGEAAGTRAGRLLIAWGPARRRDEFAPRLPPPAAVAAPGTRGELHGYGVA
jgi:hypothetical protein